MNLFNFYNKAIIKFVIVEISELVNLRKLDISNNFIEELPYTIGNLINLKWLWMNNNPTMKSNSK